ncbi:TATA box-binding protein-associated factor RNA polymerase I subunit B [Thrips palmi]|uniref:TATA box-binding protein-associated factor RNA polymerase I subunit B n=1 Tax=Thrips palmi TaxID=161013 RepID=A0A6P9A0W0_THRPL|nr:TATA box-binding protein-associated factor RNA polymerase I subunit B [Thrips palmi]
MPVCAVCSGTDFVCESGFYYCSECQTQSQDIREEVHEIDGDHVGKPVGGKRKRSSTGRTKSPVAVEENITTWEGFNFALVGLVDELISLGADPLLKKYVLRIWVAYLAKLEIAFTSKTEPAIPKLGPNYKHQDAEIIYGYSERKARQQEAKESKRKKHKKKKNDDDLLNDTNDSGKDLRKKNIRRKRVAIKMDYEKTMHEMSLASQSLTDVTLEMLSARKPDDDDECPEGEEKKQKGLQLSEIGEKFKDNFDYLHPGVLVRGKLPAILYLGLLMTGGKIKLSDLIRWMWEGHVSYSYLWKFFPPEAKIIGETYATFGAQVPPTAYHWVLEGTQQLGNFIDVKALKAPCLEDMIRHYTTELNLPDQICLIALRLLALLPKMQNSATVTVREKLPNWEGIAMAHVIVALKILFGLDDCTENRNSKVARRMNKLIASQHGSLKLFVWDDWVKFITLRQTALMLLHDRSALQNKLPTSAVQNIRPLVSLVKNKYVKDTKYATRKTILLMETHKQILSRLVSKDPLSESNDISIAFPPSISPLSDYTKVMIKACQDGQFNSASGEWGHTVRGMNLDMLAENFSSTKVDYLTHPESYVEWAQQQGLRVGLHSGSGVNDLKYPAPEKRHWKYNNLLLYRVKLILDENESQLNPTIPQTSHFTGQKRNYKCHKPIVYPKVGDGTEKVPLPMITEMTDCAPEKVIKSKMKEKKTVLKSSNEEFSNEDEENMLHTPHTEYWMLHFADVRETSFPGRYTDYKRQLPASFAFLLEECASLLEMEPSLLYREVSNLEAMHMDLASFDDLKATGSIGSNYNLKQYGKEQYVKYLKKCW